MTQKVNDVLQALVNMIQDFVSTLPKSIQGAVMNQINALFNTLIQEYAALNKRVDELEKELVAAKEELAEPEPAKEQE